MKRVNTADLVPGMITAEDVLNFNNQLILPKGLVLTDKTITKLAFYSILQVRVEDSVAQAADSSNFEPTYTERIRKSPEFIRFKKEFEEDVNSFKSMVNDVIEKGAPLDVDTLMSHTLNILNPEATSPSIFDILHCMREYDDATYVHCMNVALICNVFARWLRMEENDIKLATISGLLHDIGKTKIPDSIIKKPGKLTSQEYNIIKRHPQEGYKLLQSSSLPNSVLNAVLMHHEKCDGSGYPLGLPAEKISPFAKMVAIADVYDAMTSARVYRGPLCPFTAISLFESEGLQKYDAHYILTFLENVVNTYLLNTVRLNDGSTGKIVFINRNHLSSPTVQVGDSFIDLSQNKELYITNLM